MQPPHSTMKGTPGQAPGAALTPRRICAGAGHTIARLSSSHCASYGTAVRRAQMSHGASPVMVQMRHGASPSQGADAAWGEPSPCADEAWGEPTARLHDSLYWRRSLHVLDTARLLHRPQRRQHRQTCPPVHRHPPMRWSGATLRQHGRGDTARAASSEICRSSGGLGRRSRPTEQWRPEPTEQADGAGRRSWPWGAHATL